MAFLLNEKEKKEKNEEDESEHFIMNSFQRIAELEAQILVQKMQREADLLTSQEKLDTLTAKIDQLLVILDTLKTLGKAAEFLQKAAVFITKVGVSIGIVYAAWRFGISELAIKVKTIGSS